MNCSLALTGISVLPMAIGAVVLLVLGAVGILLARRRKSSLAVFAIILLAVSLGGISVVATPGAAQAACSTAPVVTPPVVTPPIVTPPAPVADLTDTITTDNTNVAVTGPATEDITVTVSEVAGVATSGPIVILIPTQAALATGALSSPNYDPAATTDINSNAVENSLFAFDGTVNPGYYTFTASSTVIPANGSLAFSFTVDYTSGGATGEIDANVKNGSGGETNFANNHASVEIDYSPLT